MTIAYKIKGKKRSRFGRVILGLLAITALAGSAWALWRHHGPAPEREIFQGITYGCEKLPDTPQSGGLFHWACADLNVAGVSLYITPMDEDARSHGFEYKLRHVSTAVSDAHLAAAVNGTLFSSDSHFIRLPGDLATSIETVVADHVENHLHIHTYLMWWDDQMTAHLETRKPPAPAVLAKAKWGIGGEAATMASPAEMSGQENADNRTFIAADPQRKLVWIATFDKASYNFACKALVGKGAKIALSVDGGTSTAMAIGQDAKNVRPGAVTGNWRPVATVFGFRALPLPWH